MPARWVEHLEGLRPSALCDDAGWRWIAACSSRSAVSVSVCAHNEMLSVSPILVL